MYISKNRCRKGGLVLTSKVDVTRKNNKDKLIYHLIACGQHKAAEQVQEIFDRDISVCPINGGLTFYLHGEEGHSLFDSFTWSDTPQGHAYWNDVNACESYTIDAV